MARKLILIRHGQVESLYKGKLVGSTNAELSPAGLEQAGSLHSFLARKSPDIAYSSPMKRCMDSAGAAMSGLNLELKVEELLSEVDFGDWEGLSFEELSKKDPEKAASWIVSDPDFVFPGGESLAGFLERVKAAAEMLRAEPGDTVAVFTHGGIIRFMLCQLLGLDIAKHAIFEVGYSSAFVLKLYEGAAVLSEIVKT